jgi:hypothetical protein
MASSDALPQSWNRHHGRFARYRIATIAAVATLLLWGGLAPAQQPSEQDRDRARDTMLRGDELYARGDIEGALKMFRAADAVMAVPTTGLAVARALRSLGRLLEARDAADRVRSGAAGPKEPDAFRRARDDASLMVEELDRRIPTLRLDLSAAPAAGGIRIVVDGFMVGRKEAETPRRMGAGRHTIAVFAEGHEDLAEQVTLAEGDKRTLEIRLTRKATDGRPGIASSSAVDERQRDGHRGWAYVGFGVGAAGIVAGSVTGVMSLSKASSVKDRCDGSTCPIDAKGDFDRARTLGWVSNISFGVGVAGVALGTIALLTSPGKDRKSGPASARGSTMTIRPFVGMGTLAFEGEF